MNPKKALDLFFTIKNNSLNNIAKILGIKPGVVSNIIDNEIKGKYDYTRPDFLLIESKLNYEK
jgi:hypothetical protein